MPKARKKSTIVLKLFIFLVVLILALVLFPKKTSEFSFEYSEVADIEIPENYPIHGIDLSHHNGVISWKKLKKSYLFDSVAVKFVYLKATEGRSLIDSYFSKNWEDAKTFGFSRGAYHFYITTRDPIEQAKNFCKNVRLEKGDLPPVCDFEEQLGVSKSKIQKDVHLFLTYLSEHYDIEPIIYTNPKLYERIFQGNDLFNKYHFWIAKYENQELHLHDKLMFWQHNKSGKIPGSSKSIDYNVFLGSEEDFNRILIK